MKRPICLAALSLFILLIPGDSSSQERPKPKPKFDGAVPELALMNTLLTNQTVTVNESVIFQSLYLTQDKVVLVSVHFEVLDIGRVDYTNNVMRAKFDPDNFYLNSRMGLPSIVSAFVAHGSLHNVTTPQGIGYQRTFEAILPGVFLIQPIWVITIDETKKILSGLPIAVTVLPKKNKDGTFIKAK